MPFLDGVPCSIHGFVLPDGTAALRPVEIAMLRDEAERRFVYGGLGTSWDPPAADREEMRDVVRRVGAHLQAAHGYRGAFGIDGVLTADGLPAHRAQHPDVGRADAPSPRSTGGSSRCSRHNLVAGRRHRPAAPPTSRRWCR